MIFLLNYNFYFTLSIIDSKNFTEQLIKSQKFYDDHLRHMVEISLTCIFLSTNITEIQSHAYSLLDSLVVHFTLISLAHYNNQNSAEYNDQTESNIFKVSLFFLKPFFNHYQTK